MKASYSSLLWLGGLVVCLLLAACTPAYQGVGDAFRLKFHGANQVKPTPERVASIPYAQLGVVTHHASAIFVLGNVDGSQLAWYSAEHEILFLRHGLVVKTAGLDANVLGTHWQGASPLREGLQHMQGVVQSTRSVDLSGYRIGVPVHSVWTPGPVSDITILGRTHRVRQIDEQVRAPALHWQAHNRYWVDPASGLIWKSEQTLPTGRRLTLTALKPYRGDLPGAGR